MKKVVARATQVWLLGNKERDLIAPRTRHLQAPPRKTRQAAPIGTTALSFLGVGNLQVLVQPSSFCWSQEQLCVEISFLLKVSLRMKPEEEGRISAALARGEV
jgi:hypothetical protein